MPDLPELTSEAFRLSKLLDDGCSVEGCRSEHHAKGMCGKHYVRVKTHGDPHHVERIRGDDAARFWSKVEVGVCWLWTGTTTSDGYGQMSVNGSMVATHTWAWEHLVGPVPDGHVLDHLCRVPGCVNPDHLEPVTPAENTLRGYGPPAKNARKTHCKRGHPFDDENTYVHADGRRECRACWAVRRADA